MSLNVLIAGRGRVATALARQLVAAGHRVTMLGPDPDPSEPLVASVPGARVLSAQAADPALLEGAGIRAADVVAAVSADDAHNLAVTSLARFEFGVPRTIARIVDPAHAWMFGEATGVDIAVDQAELLTRLILEEMSLGEVATLVKLRRGDFTLVEERVPAHSPAVGRALHELDFPETCVLVAVLRGADVVVPSADLTLREGDEVLALVHGEAAAELGRVLAGVPGSEPQPGGGEPPSVKG